MKDLKDIQRIMSHESVFWTGKDDGMVSPEGAAEAVLSDKRFIVLRPLKNTVFLFHALNHVTYQMHVAIVDGPARSRGVRSSIKASRWLFKNTPCRKVISFIAANHKAALAFAYQAGMKYEGTHVKSVLQDGILRNMISVGATYERFIELYGEE